MDYLDQVAQRREIRKIALQMLYQLDARDGECADEVKKSLLTASDDTANQFNGLWEVKTHSDNEVHVLAFDRAWNAWLRAQEADEIATDLAPEWPTSRQPVLDRNIIRLCWYEMSSNLVPPKAAVNEAIELAKIFGTERSAAFLNGVLDKMLKRVMKTVEDLDTHEKDEIVEPEKMTPDDEVQLNDNTGVTNDESVTYPMEQQSSSIEQTDFWTSDQ